MGEQRGEFVVYRIATERTSGRYVQPLVVVTAATRDEAERRAAELTGSRQAELAAHARAVARRLKEAGLTGAEVGAVMGVSEQRASQLLRDAG